MFSRKKFFLMYLFIFVVSPVFAQEFALDLMARPGNLPGTALVELFPSDPEISIFRITITSPQGQQTMEASGQSFTISNLTPGETYIISAVGLSSDNQVMEVSPNETVTAP